MQGGEHIEELEQLCYTASGNLKISYCSGIADIELKSA